MKKMILGVLFVLGIIIQVYAQAPDCEWVTNGGSTDYDHGNGIATDAVGNVYVTGRYQETATFGDITLNSIDGWEIFIAKLNSNGNWLWAVSAGGDQMDEGFAITTDNAGNVYVTGYFQVTANFGPFTLISSGGSDVFVAKLDSDGNWLWVKKGDGSNYDYGRGIKADSNGNAYLTGNFKYSITFGDYSLESNGTFDTFVVKIDSDGNWLWAEKAGSSEADEGHGIVIDSAGNAYITGFFSDSANFGSFNVISSGNLDIFVAKIDTDGNWQWVNSGGGSGADKGEAISLDSQGNVYIGGSIRNAATFGSIELTANLDDVCIAKLDPSGNWVWAKNAGGSHTDTAYGIASDTSGNVYVTGYFWASTVPANFGPFTLTSSGPDIFITMLDTNGNWLWAENAGGSGTDYGHEICVDTTGHLYLTGRFGETANFNPLNVTSNGDIDAFVAKLGTSLASDNDVITPTTKLSNYPNPFNPSTSISFSLSENSQLTKLEIFNVKGQLVKTLVNSVLVSGKHSIDWDGKNDNQKPVVSGIYFYRLTTNKSYQIRKMILMK